MEITPVPEAAYALVQSSPAPYHKFYLFLDYAEKAVAGLPLLIEDGEDVNVTIKANQLMTVVREFWPSAINMQVGQFFFEVGDPVLDSGVDEMDDLAYQLFNGAQYMLVSEFMKQVRNQTGLA